MRNYAFYPVKEIKDLKELLLYSSHEYGDNDAFRLKENDEIRTISYTELFQDVQALGTGLLNLNLEGKHIAIIGENSYEWVVSYLAILNGVGVAVPIDKELSKEDIINIINHSNSSALIYSNTFSDLINEITDMVDENEFVFINMNNKQNEDGLYNFYEIIQSGQELLSKGNTHYVDKHINPNEMSIIMYTSGTTGNSKGVMLSHKNVATTIVAALKTVELPNVCLSVLPIHHSFESTCGILATIFNGVTICFNDDLKYFMNDMKLFKPSQIFLVPLFVETMMKNIWLEVERKGKTKQLKTLIKVSNLLLKIGIDLRRILFKKIHAEFGGELKQIVCGGASLKPSLIQEYRNFGITLLNGYGITECSPLISVNRNNFYNDQSIGVVVPCCKVKIDKPDENGNGEILVSGSNVMLGYYNNKEATEKAFSGEWFKTGDIGRLDKQGFLYISGRQKDIIILNNGKNVYPEELEQKILKNSLVKEVVVYAATNDENKELILAEVFPDFNYIEKNNIENFEQSIRNYINNVNVNLPIFKRVHGVNIRNKEFDKTTTKKIKRHIVSRTYNSQHVHEEPKTKVEKTIAKIICNLLSIKKVSIVDNVLNIGIDSLDALKLVCELESRGYSLTIKDIYNNPTIKKLGDYLTNSQKQELDFNNSNEYDIDDLLYKDISDIKKFKYEECNINSVLLTGATGFLGIHILAELLDNTSAKIYCLVRSESKLIDSIKYYHGNKYLDEINKRIILVKGDITEVIFGLNKDDYKEIIGEIDHLIHCAADVRHFGKWDELRITNVEGTKNAIQFAKYANCKLQYISTLSVSGEELVKQTRGIVEFDEDMLYVGQQYTENVYVHSKYVAECKVIDAIRNGLNANIYRVGNVTWRYNDGVIQRNYHENWFCSLTTAFSKIGVIPENLGNILIDLTPVDKSAESIVKLLTQANCNIYHIYNPNELTMKDYLSYYNPVENAPIEKFINIITEQDYDNTMGILLTYSTVISDNLNSNELIPNVERTCIILKELGFKWPKIDSKYLKWFETIIN